MRSLRELYRIGPGPSSSHTMGPRFAAERFRAHHPDAARYRAVLYGTLAATGRGHLTDLTMESAFAPKPLDVVWEAGTLLPAHPNGLGLYALDRDGRVTASWTGYSVGGGAVADAAGTPGEEALGDAAEGGEPYALGSMADSLSWAESRGRGLWEYVYESEPGIREHLSLVLDAMEASLERGLAAEGALPGSLRLPRKAASYYARCGTAAGLARDLGLVFAYALAVAEENAMGGVVVTAPTCGSAGVLPSVLRRLREKHRLSRDRLEKALATAGLVGNIVKHNASISGAEVGCQGEVGTACAMAAAAAAQLLGGGPRHIEYAAEMGMEHHLGLTCDPVAGYVQIPCIERNAMAASRALDCAIYAILSDGSHKIPFDGVVKTMAETGRDLGGAYKETAGGGLAKHHGR